jgi:hypothetical protein
MDYKQRFSDRVENYIKYRPGYPDEIIPTLQLEIGLMPDDMVADIGSAEQAFCKIISRKWQYRLRRRTKRTDAQSC